MPTRRSDTDGALTGLLAGKAAIVTGASRGIGAAAARALATAGARVALAARDRDALTALAGELTGLGATAIAVPTDVTDPPAVAALVDRTTAAFGRLDIAVNNAGGGFRGKAPLADVPEEAFRAAIELNVVAVYTAMRHQVPAMLASGGGAIVNMSSGSGRSAARGMGAYPAAKHAVEGLTKVAALDYADQGIRVNAVAPGPILSGPLAAAPPEFREQAAAAVPAGRVGNPDEVAATVVWLCSDLASFVTGATVPIDGGQVAGVA